MTLKEIKEYNLNHFDMDKLYQMETDKNNYKYTIKKVRPENELLNRIIFESYRYELSEKREFKFDDIISDGCIHFSQSKYALLKNYYEILNSKMEELSKLLNDINNYIEVNHIERDSTVESYKPFKDLINYIIENKRRIYEVLQNVKTDMYNNL